MIDVKIKQTGNVNLLITGLEKLDAASINAAAQGLRKGLIYAVGLAQKEYLRGPRPQRLGVRSSRLLNSITSKVDVIEGRGAIGTIGTNVVYGAFHEFGFHGIVNVPAHSRVIKATGKSDAKASKGFVRAYARKVNYAGRPFVSPALERSQPIIIQSIKDELKAIPNG